MRDAHALGTPPEYLPDNGSHRFVRLQLVGIIRLFAVAVGSPRPDEIAVFLLRRQRGAGLSGNILAVNLVDEIFQRNEIAVRAPLGGEGVEAVVDGDEANSEERENSLQIVARFLVVSAKAGQVFDHDAVYMPFAYFLHHLFKLRTVKVRAASSVIAEQPIQGKRWVIFDEPEQQVFLPLYGIRAGFAAVLYGKADIGGSAVLLLRLCGSFHRRNDRVCLSFRSCHLYHLPYL